MNAAMPVAGLLLLAVLLAGARTLWRWRRQRAPLRDRGWRIAVLLLAHAAGAALLYPVLFPPPIAHDAGTLVVLTARAGEVAVAEAPDGLVVALPEATGDLPAGAQRVPDLASALRRHPGIERLHVVGTGLPARDREAARGHRVDFQPAPPRPGLAVLHAPSQVPAGRRFPVDGRAIGMAGGHAELLDPAGRRVDQAAPDDEGRFHLRGTTRAAGLATWSLRLRDAQGRVVDDVVVPLEVTAPHPLRVHVLAGSATPELKYLRRWAVDAGVELESRIDLGAGLQVGPGTVAVDAETLADIDLLVLDSRSWRNLGGGRRDALAAAVEGGLGLLLRLDRPLDAGDRERLRALGFTASTDAAPREVGLGRDLAGTGDTAAALPALTAGPRVSAADGVPLLVDASATPLAVWRAHGRGRIGVSTFDDSFRLVLAGRDDLHGELWSRLFTTLARAPGPAGAALAIEPALPHRRSVICGLGEDARVEGPDGRSTALHVDPASGPDRCAGFWAEDPGWHRVHGGEATQPFYIRDATPGAGLVAHATAAATRALAAAAPAGTPTSPPDAATRPGPRWPWFLAWLLLATATWWFERTRLGRPAVPGAAAA